MGQYDKEGSRYLLLQWVLGQTSPVFFALADKKRPILRILHSKTKYEGEFGVRYQHAGEMAAFFGSCIEMREPTPVRVHPGKMTTTQKETVVPKDDTETWEYYEYLENGYKFLNPGSLTADE